MRRAHKVDTTQSDIVAALRKVGVRVVDASALGNDFPDLICSHMGRTLLLECKTEGKNPTKGQQDFIEGWPGEVHVVYNVEQALQAVFKFI